LKDLNKVSTSHSTFGRSLSFSFFKSIDTLLALDKSHATILYAILELLSWKFSFENLSYISSLISLGAYSIICWNESLSLASRTINASLITSTLSVQIDDLNI
jgi:hypothetical protein